MSTLRIAPVPAIREDKVAEARRRLPELLLKATEEEYLITRLLDELTASHPRQLRIKEDTL